MDLNFTPIILPEDKIPSEAVDYKQCEVCTPKSPIIWGEGNTKASMPLYPITRWL